MKNKIKEILHKYLVVRYVISGGLSSGIDIMLFVTLIEVFEFHYIISASISVTFSFVLRFLLQKKFAFKDEGLDVHRQVLIFSLLYGMSMVMTTALLYVFIDLFHIGYMIAQVFTIGIIAVISFFVYRYVIFRKNTVNISEDQLL